MNRIFKAEIVRRYGSQANFAVAVGIWPSKLSMILHGRAEPNDDERAKLNEIFGARRVGKLLRNGSQLAAGE